MADFNAWIQPGKRRYRRIYGSPPNYVTYQNLPNDAGNWTGGAMGSGIQAGTNRSIAASTLTSWRGHHVTAAEMQALTAQEALQIYKVKFWDKILGDQIKSQVMAEFIADMKSSVGNNKPLQRALNTLGYPVSVDGSIGQQTLAAINAAQNAGKTPQLYNLHRQEMIAHYQGNQDFGNALIDQLNNDYPQRAANDPIFGQVSTGTGGNGGSGGGMMFLGVVMIGVATAALWKRSKK